MTTKTLVHNDNTPIEPKVLKPKIGPNRKERREKLKISEPNYPKVRTKPGHGRGSIRPGRGYEREVKIQKIIAGLSRDPVQEAPQQP